MPMTPRITRIVQASSRPSHTWSFWTQLAPKMLSQKSYPCAWSRPSTTTWPANSFEKLSLAPISTKNVPSVTIKLGSRVFSTTVPLNQPTSIAKANASGTAMNRLRPAPPFSPTSLERRMTSIAVAPVIDPAERSNSPDHQQRDGDRHDPEDRRHIQVVGRASGGAEH